LSVRKKLSYDIWGDTVIQPGRMESSGDAGKINISSTTYEFLKDFFVCEYRGKMPVKNIRVNLICTSWKELSIILKMKIMDQIISSSLKCSLSNFRTLKSISVKCFDDEAPPNLYFHNLPMQKILETR